MKKFVLPLIAAATLSYSNFSESMQTINKESNWTGFYLGANAGYWKSQTNDVTTTGSVSFINQTFESGSSDIANALAQIATNSFSLHPDGFIGGGQVGFNYQFSKGILLGLNTDFDGLSNSNNRYNLQKTVNLADFAENYAGSLSVKQKINYLGTVRARFGYLFCPTFLIYATGGFAYGNVTLDTAWVAQESLGSAVFPGIATQSNVSKTLTGWTAGGGIEWLFKSNWSASLEYIYYGLNGLKTSANLAQINASISPPSPWGSAIANTALSLSVGSIRLGVNYHFA
ncbi:MAG: outer membrane protein [Gammaproteobacteria bacterium]